MTVRVGMWTLIVAAALGCAVAQTYPVLNITKGGLLPVLPELQPDADGWITLEMAPATLQVNFETATCLRVTASFTLVRKVCVAATTYLRNL